MQVEIAPALVTYRELIDQLKTECNEELTKAAATNKELYDDIWLLRFVLSHKEEAKEEPFTKMKDAVIKTLEWRTQHRDLLARLRAGEAPPHDGELCKYSIADLHKTTKDGRPVLIVRTGISNTKLMMEAMSEEKVYEFFSFNKEYIFGILDRKTRESGRIVKALSIMDMKASTMFGSMSKPFFRAMGKAGKEGELFYPQFQDITVLINTPTWLNVMLGIGKLFMSKRSMDKLKVCPARTSTGDIKTCPYVAANFDIADIPTFLGGTCTCPHKAPEGVDASIGACCRGFPNKWKTQLTEEDIAKLSITPLGQMERHSFTELIKHLDEANPASPMSPPYDRSIDPESVLVEGKESSSASRAGDVSQETAPTESTSN